MSLREKLSNIEEENQKAEELKQQEDEKEKSSEIQFQIEELESKKYQLELIKDSLTLKPDESNVEGYTGMKDFSDESEKKIKNAQQEVKNILQKHKETLSSMGVESSDDLINNPDFSEEEEIIAHKKVIDEEEEIKQADDALIAKLKQLGVEFDIEDFSYDFVGEAIGEKLESLDKELIEKKLTTPKGREELEAELSEELKSEIPEMSFFNGQFKLDRLEYRHNYDPNSIEHFARMHLPQTIDGLIDTYQKGITKAALKNAYSTNLEELKDKIKKIDIPKLENELERLKEQRGYTKSELSEKSTYIEMKKDKLQRFVDNLENTKEQLGRGIDVGFILKELEGLGFNYPRDVKYFIDRLRENQIEAQSLISEISTLELTLPKDEELSFKGGRVSILSIDNELDDLRKKRAKETEIMDTINKKISKHKSIIPNIFSKKKWVNELDELENQLHEVENTEKQLQEQYNKTLNKRPERTGGNIKSRELERLLNKQDITGFSSTIFDALKIKLKEIIDKQEPTEAINLAREYEEISKDL